MKRIVETETPTIQPLLASHFAKHIQDNPECIVVKAEYVDDPKSLRRHYEKSNVGLLHATTYRGQAYEFLALNVSFVIGNSWTYVANERATLNLNDILRQVLNMTNTDVFVFDDFTEFCKWYASL